LRTITKGQLDANGLRFAFLEAGEGPVVVLLHGFPDNAWTWEAQLASLADAGYRAVAPFLRGYPPTAIPADGRYDAPTLAADLAGLVHALGGAPAHVVGHDWGAVMAYAGMAFEPEVVRRSVVLAVNHPQRFASLFSSPQLIHRNFHQWFFQLDGYAEAAARANDLALIDYLWRFWSPDLEDEVHLERVKRETLAEPGGVEAALSYYRALLTLPAVDQASAETLFQPVATPTLQIFGEADPLAQPTPGEEACFSGDHEQEILGGVGHFLQRERPEEVTSLILEWFDRRHAKAAEIGRGGRDDQRHD
jgi:pimeloyl-ACP methyl ester carboxylesterase